MLPGEVEPSGNGKGRASGSGIIWVVAFGVYSYIETNKVPLAFLFFSSFFFLRLSCRKSGNMRILFIGEMENFWLLQEISHIRNIYCA
jgi:hypothetical protein